MQRTPGFCKRTLARLLGCLLAAQLSVWPAITQAASSEGSNEKTPKLFTTDATLPLTLTAPWRDYVRNKNSKKPYAGTLEYVDDDGTKHALPVQFQTRGHNRLKVCPFPPTKVIFDKAAAAGTPFRGNKSLKLTTHCGDGERWQQYAPKELLAYHIYNLVTERSFRVRPVSVTYVDNAEHSSDGPRLGFLVEDDSGVAKRNALQKLEVPSLPLERLEPLEASRMALFEYLIGNTDFAVLAGPTRCCHNAVLMSPDPQARVFAVPYDFDSSGLVDTHYSEPSPTLHIRSNRERVFRGFCSNNATLETARREYLRLEPRILELVRTDARLSEKSRRSVGDYLGDGFAVLRDDMRFAREITAQCRK